MRFVVLLALLACAGCAANNVGGGERVVRDQRASRHVAVEGHVLSVSAAAAPAAVTLTWTMPRLKANGDTLGTAPLDYEVAYSHRSQTYIDHEFWIRNFPDTMTKYWPAVRVECERLVVASGTAVPGERVAWPALPVPAGHWSFSWWVRSRQRPNGAWSAWSYPPVTRADNN